MSKAIQVHVADSLDTIGYRVVEAWRRAEYDGLARDNVEVHIGFESWETMVRTLSPQRLELLASSSPQSGKEHPSARAYAEPRLLPSASGHGSAGGG
jgi:predicted transcriptional regulator